MDRRFAIVGVLKCEQTVLGIIGDFMIQVDSVFLSVAYTEAGAGYQISIRSCHEKLHADKIAAYICDGVGGTGEVEVTQYESLTIGQHIRLWNGAGPPSLDENFSWGVIIGFKAPFIQFDLENKEALGEAENPAWIHIQLVRESLAMMR